MGLASKRHGQHSYNDQNEEAFHTNLFLCENSKKQEKEASTNFVLLSHWRNMIGRFMKTY